MIETLLLISTICFVVLTALFAAVLVIALKMFVDLKEVLKTIRHESEFIAADIHELRQKIKDRAETASKVAGVLAATRAATSFFRLISRDSRKITK